MNTLGSLKEDESGYRFIIVIVDNFFKLVGLYPAQNTTSKKFVRALLQWVINFRGSKRDPHRWRFSVHESVIIRSMFSIRLPLFSYSGISLTKLMDWSRGVIKSS